MATEKKTGLQKDGTFIASNLKQFGRMVDALAGKSNPGAIYLKTGGLIRKKVSKNGRLYSITQYTNGRASQENKVPSTEFEKNYRWFI